MWKCVTYPGKEEFLAGTIHEVFVAVDSNPAIENFSVKWEN